jgi:uncharacterized membrane protein
MTRSEQPPQGPDGGEVEGSPPQPQSSQAGAPPSQLTVQWQQQQQQFAGPLPPPDILQGYENVLPGSAERILAMAERQAAHRQYLEQKIVEDSSQRANIGMWLGFSIAIVVLAVSAALIWTGYGWQGTVLGSVDVVGLATVFVVGRAEQRRERVEKAEYAG